MANMLGLLPHLSQQEIEMIAAVGWPKVGSSGRGQSPCANFVKNSKVWASRLQRRRRTRLHTAGHNDGGSNSTQIR
jgi:hypothetical protein